MEVAHQLATIGGICDVTNTAQKMKFSIKDFFSKYETVDLVTFTEEIPNGKLQFFV